MKYYPNLPHRQWSTQSFVDLFNKDEARWGQLLLQRLRRKLKGNIPVEQQEVLDLLDAKKQSS